MNAPIQEQLDQINREITHEGHMLRMKFATDRTKYEALDAKRATLEACAKEKGMLIK